MRASRAFWAAGAAVLVASSTGAVAGAFIAITSSGVTRLAAAPPSVALNALESPTAVFAFDERQNVTLTSALAIDFANPGTYGTFPTNSGKLPVGSVVDSHLIHSDPTSPGATTRRAGSVTVQDDIVGVVASTAKLASSDSLGAPGTTYAGTLSLRGLENSEDKLTISADRRTVSFDIRTTSVIDDIRVLTRHVNHLATVITDAPDPVQTDDQVVYTITVTNNRPVPAPDVHVADQFPGATFVSATSSGGCTGTVTVDCGLGTLAVGASASATVTVKAPSTVPSGATIVNTASSPPGETPLVNETTTVVDPVLDTVISDSPDPVTSGDNVQYTLTVTNHGIAPVTNAHVVDTLPPGTTLVGATATGGCIGAGPVDCTLGPLAVNASATAFIVVTSPAVVPVSGTITDSGVASPGANAPANETTTVEPVIAGVAKGFVLPGGSITIPGTDPATVTLPVTGGGGAPVIITQGPGTFCDGPCAGIGTTVSAFPGFTDPSHPIHLTLTYEFPDAPDSLTNAATAFGATIYKNDDPLNPTVGTPVPFCATPGIATPHPCVDSHTIVQPTPNSFVVTFEIVYLSGDPVFARR